jgi:hypothetical protein
VHLDEFARRRTQGASVLAGLAVSLGPTGMNAVVERLEGLGERAAEGRFVVLLLGCFSTGKSTLVNALLSRPALPAKVNPCTAILTEVVYGAEPAVVVHTTDGGSERLSVEAFLEEYQLRTGEDLAGDERADRFGRVERAVLEAPLPLLNNGVTLLDTPGLDDDPARTARTLDSLPDADAVIFVLNATRFLTELERTTLSRHLLPLGLQNLFFVTTMVDLLAALADDPEVQRKAIQERAASQLVPLCPEGRFDERFFLVDARGALLARYDRDAAERREQPIQPALNDSGVPAFEASLEHFLVHERGRAQLEHLVMVTRHCSDEIARQAALDRATADSTAAELSQRQEELAPRFDELSRIAARVERIGTRFVQRQQDLVFQDLRDFIARAEEELPDAVAGFDLGSVAGLDLLTPSGRNRVEARLREELRIWLDQRTSQWQVELTPRLERSLADLRVELEGDATDFDALCAEIVSGFSRTRVPLPDSTSDDGPMGAAERWTSLALGALLLSPGTMAAGWTQGYEGVLHGAATRLGIRVAIITLGALLGPVGWLGLALYVVSDAVVIGLTGGRQLKRLRQQVADGLHGKLVAQVDAAAEDLKAKVSEAFTPLMDALTEAARNDVAELRAALKRVVAARTAAAETAAARGEMWEGAETAVSVALRELGELADL